MIKRLAANLILDSGIVINSYKFKKHLPVGKLQHSLKRLQEFEVDEVIILNTSHSSSPIRDFSVLMADMDSWHISTPLAYGGGIECVSEAAEVIKAGAERVVVSSNVFLREDKLVEICEYLGDQAVILHLPLQFVDGDISIHGKHSMSLKHAINFLPEHWGGEIMFSFVANDGAQIPDWQNISSALGSVSSLRNLILAGGFSNSLDIGRGLSLNQVSALSIGNFLHRTELSIVNLKKNIDSRVELRREL
jgi:cyclase